MKSKKILIITAHLDDFEVGMGGTIAKISDTTDAEISLYTFCNGERPGKESVASSRLSACKANCERLGIKRRVFGKYPDTKLDKISQTDLCNEISNQIEDFQPDTVYTHFDGDVHNDHRIISNVTKVACRMRQTSPVNALYEYSVPGSTEWNFKSFNQNTFEDTSKYLETKISMISNYFTEVKDFPDPMSIKAITAHDQYIGSLCGCEYAESFNLVYNRNVETSIDDS